MQQMQLNIKNSISILIQLTKYSVEPKDNQTIEELMEEVTDNLSFYVEDSIDTSATIIHKEGTDNIIIKILKLNEHSN